MSRARAKRSAKPKVPSAPPPAVWPLVVRAAPGLGRVLAPELRHAGLAGRKTRIDTAWQRNHDLLFLPKPPREPAPTELRVAEEVHHCLVFGRYKFSSAQLETLAGLLARRGRHWHLAVSVDGKHFNRFDLTRWLGKQLQHRGLRIDDAAPASVFVFAVEAAYYVCVRTRTAADVAERDARAVERPGSLPPSVAAAMAFLGKPGRRDTICDPVCGSGTLLAEAAAYISDAGFVGADTDMSAVKAARRNLAHVGGARVESADARALPLGDGTVSLTLANLPFGKQFGPVDGTPGLYDEILREQGRVAAREGWRGVVLAGEHEALESAARTHGFTVTRSLDVRVRGEPAALCVLVRSAGRADGAEQRS